MPVEESVVIARPAETVWDLVSNPSNEPRWCRKVKAVEPVGDRCWRVVHKPVPLRPAAELMVEHLELIPPQRLTMLEEDAASVVRVEYRLVRAPTGTRFTQVSDFEWKQLPRILHPPFARGVRRDMRRQLQALKRILEQA